MSLLNDAIDRLLSNETKLDKLVNGDSQTVVQTDNGLVPSVSKVIHDAQEKIDGFIPELADKEVKLAKDTVDGYAGLGSDFMLRIKNMAGTVASYISSEATQKRVHVLQDRDGTLAHVSDIPKPEDRTSLLKKLDVTDIQEPATLKSLGAQPNLGYVPLDVRMGDQPEGFPKLDENLKLDPKYFPDSAEAILPYPTLADFPEEGMSKRIYIDASNSRPYTWDGDSYEALKVDIGDTDTLDEGEVNKFFTMDRVLDGVLTGFNMIKSGYVTGADTLIDALGKLQRLITEIQAKFEEYAALTGAVFTGNVQVPTTDASVASKDVVNVEAMKQVTDVLEMNLTNSINLRESLINKAINFATLDDQTYPTTKAVSTLVTTMVDTRVPIGENGKIASVYMPSYVDDVLEFDTKALLPVEGERGKIYVVLADETNAGKTWQYRWSGTSYAAITPSPGTTDAIVEGATNKYFTVSRVLASAMTGFSSAVQTAVNANDTVLQSVGKLQGQINAIWVAINAIPYDIAGGFAGKPAANDVSVMLVAIRKFTIPLDLSLAKGIANAAATGAYVVSLTKNGVQFATLTWSAAGTVPVFANTTGAVVVINAGDVLRVVAPAAVDATISDISFTLPATLG